MGGRVDSESVSLVAGDRGEYVDHIVAPATRTNSCPGDVAGRPRGFCPNDSVTRELRGQISGYTKITGL